MVFIAFFYDDMRTCLLCYKHIICWYFTIHSYLLCLRFGHLIFNKLNGINDNAISYKMGLRYDLDENNNKKIRTQLVPACIAIKFKCLFFWNIIFGNDVLFCVGFCVVLAQNRKQLLDIDSIVEQFALNCVNNKIKYTLIIRFTLTLHTIVRVLSMCNLFYKYNNIIILIQCNTDIKKVKRSD